MNLHVGMTNYEPGFTYLAMCTKASAQYDVHAHGIANCCSKPSFAVDEGGQGGEADGVGAGSRVKVECRAGAVNTTQDKRA